MLLECGFEDFDGDKNNLTKDNIIAVGKKKKVCKDNEEAYSEGCQLIRIPKSDILDKLKSKGLQDKALIILPYEKYGGIDKIDPENDSLIKSRLTKLADIIESSNAKQVTFFNGNSTALPLINEDGSKNDKFTTFIGKPKPCISGSYSHKPETIGVFPEDKDCWIKADPTFEGLRQIIYEPDRVYIGSVLPSGKNTSNIIDRIEIKDSNNWFEETVTPLNENLITIIGEKGAGKTALADFIALACGDFEVYDDDPGSFVFKALKSTKQIEETIDNCTVTVYWKDGEHDSITINDSFSDYNDLKKVRYLSQSFIERKCRPEQAGELQREIEDIIFQHIPIQDRLSQTTFSDLKDFKTESVRLKQASSKNFIGNLNQTIFDIEEQISSLPAKKEEKVKLQAEIKQLEGQKPTPTTKEDQEIADKLALLNTHLADLNEKIADNKAQLTTIGTIRVQVSELTEYVDEKINDIKDNLELVGLTAIRDKLELSIHGDFNLELDKKSEAIKAEIKFLSGIEDQKNNGEKKELEKVSLESLSTAYINSLSLDKVISLIAVLESKSSIAEGVKKAINTFDKKIRINQRRIAELHKIIKEIEEIKRPLLPEKIKARNNAYKYFIDLFIEEKSILEEIYSPLKEKLLKEAIGEENKIDFFARVEFNINAFFDRADTVINFNKSGPYHHDKPKLFKAIKAISEKIELAENLNVHDHISELYDSFENDGNTTFEIGDQILTSRNKLDFYNWIFDVSDFKVNYSIKYQETNIELLSPGKKGIVLLLMYLALDTESSIPLIIDQPEENLDNKSVYTDLINFFRKCKKRRQIIVITHNPNLVLNTDAEQIIVANFEAVPNTYKSRITYVSGAIENSFIDMKLEIPLLRKGIREHGADILEGGKEAFIKRKDKYSFNN